MKLWCACIGIVMTFCGCSRAEPRACQPPRSYWIKPHNFVGLMPMRNEVSITHTDTIFWNGKPISSATLDRYLKLSHTFNPEPEVFLSTEMGASCAAVEAVRNRMDEDLDCKKSYPVCAEGIRGVWSKLPTPPGGVVS
jgi:hypothetical protein